MGDDMENVLLMTRKNALSMNKEKKEDVTAQLKYNRYLEIFMTVCNW